MLSPPSLTIRPSKRPARSSPTNNPISGRDKSQRTNNDGNRVFIKHEEGVELSKEQLDAARTLFTWTIPIINPTQQQPDRQVVDSLELIERNQPDPEDDKLYPCTNAQKPQEVEEIFADPDDPKKFNSKKWSTKLELTDKFKELIDQECPRLPKKEKEQFYAKVIASAGAEIEPRKQHRSPPSSKYLEARPYKPEEIKKLPFWEQFFLKNANGLFFKKDVKLPLLKDGYAGPAYPTANLNQSELRQLHKDKYAGFAEDNTVDTDPDQQLSPGGNGSSPQFANAPLKLNPKTENFVNDRSRTTLKLRIINIIHINRDNPAEKILRPIVFTPLLSRARPGGEARYPYNKNFAKDLAKLYEKYRDEIQRYFSQMPVIKTLSSDSEREAPTSRAFFLRPTPRTSAPLEMGNNTPRHPRSKSPSVTSDAPSAFSLSTVREDLSDPFSSSSESESSSSKWETSVDLKAKIQKRPNYTATQIMDRNFDIFKTNYERKGLNDTQKLFDDPKLTRSIIEKYAKANDIHYISGASLLRADKKKFTETYQAGGYKRVIKVFRDPRVTENAIHNYARKLGITRIKPIQKLRLHPVEVERAYREAGPAGAIALFPHFPISEGTVYSYAREMGFSQKTSGIDILEANIPKFKKAYQKGGSKQVVAEFNHPLVTRNVARNFAISKEIRYEHESPVDILRDNEDEVARVYKKYRKKGILELYPDAGLTPAMIDNYAREKKLVYQTGTDLLKEKVAEWKELFEKSGAPAVVKHFNDHRITLTVVNKYAKKQGIHHQTGEDLLKAREDEARKIFNTKGSKGGAKGVVEKFNDPRVTMGVVYKFMERK